MKNKMEIYESVVNSSLYGGVFTIVMVLLLVCLIFWLTDKADNMNRGLFRFLFSTIAAIIITVAVYSILDADLTAWQKVSCFGENNEQ